MTMEFSDPNKNSLDRKIRDLNSTINKLKKQQLELELSTQHSKKSKPQAPITETLNNPENKKENKFSILNKVRAMKRWQKIAVLSAVAGASALATLETSSANNSPTNKDSAQEILDKKTKEKIKKIEKFNQVSQYINEKYYKEMESTDNYTAQLDYLKRADALEKGGIIGKSLMIGANPNGAGYTAYCIDNENRIVDSTNILTTEKFSYYEIANLGGDIIAKNDASIKRVEHLLGIKFSSKILKYLEPIKTRRFKTSDVEPLYSHITVTPKHQIINGKIAMIGNETKVTYQASGIKYIAPEKFNKTTDDITKIKMPSKFTLFKEATVGGEGGNDYSIECSVGPACGPYQIIPSWHFHRVNLDYTDPKDREYFITHPSIQDLTYRLYYKELIEKHGEDNIAHISADYFHGDEAVKAYGTPYGDTLTDPLGTTVNNYVHGVLKRRKEFIEKSIEKIKSSQ